MKLLEAKVVLLGSQGVGKTSIIIRHTSKAFHKHVSPTIGASFFSCAITLSDYRVRLQVWDTAGQERFRAMAPMYYRNCNASFLVYDITSYESYMAMKTWIDELKRNVDRFVYICILGNKCDLDDQREVKSEEAQEYAEMVGAAYIETSALVNDGIEEAFVALAKGLVEAVENGSSNAMLLLNYGSSSESDNGHGNSTMQSNASENITLSKHRTITEESEKPRLCC